MLGHVFQFLIWLFQMSYTLGDTTLVTRSCNSTVEYTTDCESNNYASGVCEYCCEGDYCNDDELTAAQCEAMRDSGAEGCHKATAYIIGSFVMVFISILL